MRGHRGWYGSAALPEDSEYRQNLLRRLSLMISENKLHFFSLSPILDK